jgi:hypothetical protein
MSDIVKQLLFRSSDEAGIGWTPTTVVHVPAGLLHQAADEITRLTARVAELEAALKEIAAQKKTTELVTACDVEYADFEDGYDMCIDRARAALTQPAEEKPND